MTSESSDRPKPSESCCSREDRAWARRDFLAISGLAATGTLVSHTARPLMAGPFENENEYLNTIPIDKKLDRDWLGSLTARGTKETYTHPDALGHIGMPVGGLFAGSPWEG